MARRTVRKLVAALALAGVVTPAVADPVTAAIAVFSAVANVSVWVKAVLLVATMAYGDAKMRRERRAAEAAAKAAYNSNLSDRYVTALRAAPPLRYVYGRCWTGGDIVAVFTTDKTAYNDKNELYTKPDAYKHLVVAFASHQSQAFHDVALDGKSIALSGVDANGWSQATDFSRKRRATRRVELAAGASVTFDYPILATGFGALSSFVGVAAALNQFGSMGANPTYTLSNGNKTLTNTHSGTATFTVVIEEVVSSVRVSVHTGTDTQAADSYLMSVIPSKWTANHRLRGITYAVITLDLEDKRFQGGPPQITAELSGRLLFDPRTSTTAWSDNNALVARDYLLNMCKVPAAMIDDTAVGTTANACGSLVNNRKRIGGSLNTVSKAKFTFNGVVTSDDSREATLDAIADSMAGWISQSGKWTMDAGTWTAPVMSLGDDDLDGQIELIQGGTTLEALFNGVRGQFIPAGTAVPVDFQPYKNAAFVTADGRARWKNKNLPFTDDEFIATSIARIITERARNGLIIRYPAKLKAWPLRIGERVTVTSAEYGFSSKTFRVTDWQFSEAGAVMLTLQEDAASAYDLVDEVTADPTPNTGLPNPFDAANLPEVANFTCVSSDATVRRQTDGTFSPRIKASWDMYSGPYVTDGSGYINLKWQRIGRDDPSSWKTLRLPGNATQAYIDGVTDGDIVMVGVWAQNGAGGTSPEVWRSVTVVGKTAVPPDVTGFAAVSVPGAINIVWNECTDADYEETEVRIGSTWATGTRIFKGRANTYSHPQAIPSSIVLQAKHYDKWGNESGGAPTISASSLSLDDTRNYDFTNGLTGWTAISAVSTGDTGSSGGTYGQHNGSIGTPAYPAKVPVDPYRRYRVTGRVWSNAGGGGPIYMGVIPFDASGTILSNVGGSTYPYCAAAGIANEPGWRIFSGEISGVQAIPTATLDHNKFPVGTCYASPMVFPYTGYSGPLLIDYLMLEDITDVRASEGGGFSAYRLWDFNSNTVEGFAAGSSTVTLSATAGVLIVTSLLADAQFRTPNDMGFSGAVYDKIRMRIRRVAGTSWQGDVYYLTNGGHGESDLYKLSLPSNLQPSSDWTIIEWDALKHATNLNDWRSGSIYQLRFDLAQGGIGDQFEIDWIAIGRYAAAQDLTGVGNSQWVGRGVSVVGDVATKSLVSNSWDADVYSREKFYGGCIASASFSVEQGGLVMFGLNSDPLTDANYTSLDYAWYLEGNIPRMRIFESGVDIGVVDASPASTDVYSVAYDGSKIYYTKNGSVYRSVAAPPGLSFFFDSSFGTVSGNLRGMRFGPLTSNDWQSIGGAAKPSDYATADLVLVNDANCVQQGNRITKVAGAGAWDAGAHSKDGYLGGASCSIYVHNSQTESSKEAMFGLNNSPTTPSYTDINFAFYMVGAGGGVGNLYAYLEGSIGNGGSAIGTFADNDVLSITYDGYKARWYKNGALLFELSSVDTTSRWYFDCSIVQVGEFFDRITFRPMSMVAGVDTPQLVNGATYGSAFEDTTVSTADPATFTGNTTIDCTDSTYSTDGTTKVLVMGEVLVSMQNKSGTIPDHIRLTMTPRFNGTGKAQHNAGPLMLRDVGHTPDWNLTTHSFHYSYLEAPTAGSKTYDATVLVSLRDSGGNELSTSSGYTISVTHSIVIVEFKR